MSKRSRRLGPTVGILVARALTALLRLLGRSPGAPHAAERASWPDGRASYFIAADLPTAAEFERDRASDDVYALDEDYEAAAPVEVDVSTAAESQITARLVGARNITSHPTVGRRLSACSAEPARRQTHLWF